jgi:hypothetical protein
MGRVGPKKTLTTEDAEDTEETKNEEKHVGVKYRPGAEVTSNGGF